MAEPNEPAPAGGPFHDDAVRRAIIKMMTGSPFGWTPDQAAKLVGPADGASPAFHWSPGRVTIKLWPPGEADPPPVDLNHAAVWRLTDRARRCLSRAGREATALGHPSAVGLHLLLGLLEGEGGRGIGGFILTEAGVTAAAVRAYAVAALGQVTPNPGVDGAGEKSRSVVLDGVVRLAAAQALALRCNYVGTEHLLLGVLSDKDGSANVLLRRTGVDASELVRRTLELIDPQAVTWSPYPGHVEAASVLLDTICAALDGIERLAAGNKLVVEQLARTRQELACLRELIGGTSQAAGPAADETAPTAAPDAGGGDASPPIHHQVGKDSDHKVGDDSDDSVEGWMSRRFLTAGSLPAALDLYRKLGGTQEVAVGETGLVIRDRNVADLEAQLADECRMIREAVAAEERAATPDAGVGADGAPPAGGGGAGGV